MSISDDEPELTCEYVCFSGTYILEGGSAPEGYYCPDEAGPCDLTGTTVNGPPLPIDEEPTPVPDPPIGEGLRSFATVSSESNAATYAYHFSSGKLYFASGKADKGNGFFSSLTLDQLSTYYPSIAEDVSVLLAVKSLASFKLTLPALPASVVARRDD
jgi:hypothetical protein